MITNVNGPSILNYNADRSAYPVELNRETPACLLEVRLLDWIQIQGIIFLVDRTLE